MVTCILSSIFSEKKKATELETISETSSELTVGFDFSRPVGPAGEKMATHELAEKTEAENLDEILSSYEKCSNECANFLAKLEGLDGVVFKELTNESKVSLSPELLSGT